jgi:hypothetical protein
MTTLENKIAESFKSEFELNADKVNIQGINAFVCSGNLEYWCKLTSNGVKKNSWRLEVYN